MNRQQALGRDAESAAAEYLIARGCRVLEKNYRTRFGEVDLVVRQEHTLVFVEVKARRTDRRGCPQAAVGPDKQRRIRMAALHYLRVHRLQDVAVRFDVMAVTPGEGGYRFKWIPGAFGDA